MKIYDWLVMACTKASGTAVTFSASRKLSVVSQNPKCRSGAHLVWGGVSYVENWQFGRWRASLSRLVKTFADATSNSQFTADCPIFEKRSPQADPARCEDPILRTEGSAIPLRDACSSHATDPLSDESAQLATPSARGRYSEKKGGG